jgi:hypothetical protein
MRCVLTAAVLGASFFVAPDALSAEATEPPAAPDAERHAFVVGNVLSLAMGRLSIDAGTLVAPHLAPVMSAHVQALPSVSGGRGQNAVLGYGAELGMRFYSHAHAPSGFFLGAYVVGGRYRAQAALFDGDGDSVDVISYGAAFDLGWSWVTSGGVVIAFGAGLDKRWAQRTAESRGMADDTPSGPGVPKFFTEGINPRVLAQVGYAF